MREHTTLMETYWGRCELPLDLHYWTVSNRIGIQSNIWRTPSAGIACMFNSSDGWHDPLEHGSRWLGAGWRIERRTRQWSIERNAETGRRWSGPARRHINSGRGLLPRDKQKHAARGAPLGQWWKEKDNTACAESTLLHAERVGGGEINGGENRQRIDSCWRRGLRELEGDRVQARGRRGRRTKVVTWIGARAAYKHVVAATSDWIRTEYRHEYCK